MPGVILSVKKHGCLIENKNIVKTFCNCKPSSKNTEPHQNFTGSHKKSVEALDELQGPQNIRKKKKIKKKLW